MDNYVGEGYACLASENGIKIGEIPATKETKGSWSELYYYDGKLVSVLMYDLQSCYVFDGLIVDESELSKHVVDLDFAIFKINEIKSKL